MPRRVADRGSPTFQAHRRVSQSPSSAVSDSSSIPAHSSPSQRRATAAACPVPNIPLTGGRTVSGDLTDARYDGQNYASPASSIDQRRISIISSTSSSYANDNRPSPYLPPVASLTSSRGSSFDMDPSDRPQLPVTLPSLFAHTLSLPQATQQSYTSSIENDMRYQQSSQEYHRYSAGSGVPSGSSYRSSSPVQQYPNHYYSHSSFSQPQRGSSYATAQPMAVGGGSPFSTSGHPVDMTMDHFDHGRPGKRRRGNLPKHVTDLLRGWLNDHLHHPYPTEDEKQMLMAQTGLNINQVCINGPFSWIANLTYSAGKQLVH